MAGGEHEVQTLLVDTLVGRCRGGAAGGGSKVETETDKKVLVAGDIDDTGNPTAPLFIGAVDDLAALTARQCTRLCSVGPHLPKSSDAVRVACAMLESASEEIDQPRVRERRD